MLKKIVELSEDECEKELTKHLKNNSKSKVKQTVAHSKRVLEICKKIVTYYDDDLEEEMKKLLYISAMFHDIAKFDDNKRHHKKAKNVLNIMFKEDEHYDKVCRIIACHKKEFIPEKDILIPAAILRIADKIDKINKDKIGDFVDKYSSSMEKIKESFIKNGKDFEKFKEACDIVKIETIIDKKILKKSRM